MSEICHCGISKTAPLKDHWQQDWNSAGKFERFFTVVVALIPAVIGLFIEWSMAVMDMASEKKG